MRKDYIQPSAEILCLKALDDFLLLSPGLDTDEEEDNGMGDSSGGIKPDIPGIWG